MASAGTCLKCGWRATYDSGDVDKDRAVAASLMNQHSAGCTGGQECATGHADKVSAGVNDRHVCPDCFAVVNDSGEVVRQEVGAGPTTDSGDVVNPPMQGEQQ